MTSGPMPTLRLAQWSPGRERRNLLPHQASDKEVWPRARAEAQVADNLVL